MVSADGLALASSEGFPPDRADQLAAVAAGLLSLTGARPGCSRAAWSSQTVVEMQRGLLLVMAISDGRCWRCWPAPDCDMGLVAYQMTLLVDRAGQVLTPAVRAELRAARTR